MRRQRPALMVAGAVACLAACSSPVPIDSPPLAGDEERACQKLVDALPERVGDQDRRDVEGGLGAAYGDPPIVVRCGVELPDELLTSCFAVNGIDWYVDEADDAVVALTAGREPSVEVRVPASYGASNAALVDVTAIVESSTSASGKGC
ncbi:MAG TPA: DUF3515 domain-containing protein [Nocardioidaceae bacterium]|nr:DUF3515 domain-containing protein [Nocardioidaceae bacterium]